MRRDTFHFSILLLAAAVLASSARGETVAGDAARGNIRSKAEQCQECHGEAGISTSEHYAKLAGQISAYLRSMISNPAPARARS